MQTYVSEVTVPVTLGFFAFWDIWEGENLASYKESPKGLYKWDGKRWRKQRARKLDSLDHNPPS